MKRRALIIIVLLLLITVFTGIYVSAQNYSFSDISRDSFYKQQICVHHDSFLRESEPKRWHVGGNGDEKIKLDYYSPRDDYENVDDGFFIENGQMRNNRHVDVEESFRLINVSLKNEFVIETCKATDGAMQRFVFNFSSPTQYDAIIIYYKRKTAKMWMQKVRGGKSTKEKLGIFSIQDANIRFHFIPSRFRILNGDRILSESGYTIKKKMAVGMAVDRNHDYVYDFFNVFNIVDFRTFDYNVHLDKLETTFSKSHVEGDLYDYSYALNRDITCNSQVSERFELHKNTCTDYKNDRVERVLDIPVRNNLRRVIISFDVYLEEPYSKDELYEIIFQIHEGLFGDKVVGRSPSFSVMTENGEWVIRQLAADKMSGKKGEDYAYKKVAYVGNYTIGEWTHFDIYMKEGYESAQSPFMKVFINNRCVYISNKPNCYNTPRGGYVRYGLYKAAWLTKQAHADKRSLFVDNLIVRM